MADTIVERDSTSSSNGLLVGVLLALLVVVLFFLLGGASLFRGIPTPSQPAPQSQPQGGQGGSVDINVPEEININTPDGGQ
jgi:hypothetical protein